MLLYCSIVIPAGSPLALSHVSSFSCVMTSIGWRPVRSHRSRIKRRIVLRLRLNSPPALPDMPSRLAETGALRVWRTCMCGVVTSMSATTSTCG